MAQAVGKIGGALCPDEIWQRVHVVRSLLYIIGAFHANAAGSLACSVDVDINFESFTNHLTGEVYANCRGHRADCNRPHTEEIYFRVKYKSIAAILLLALPTNTCSHSDRYQ